MSKKLKIGTCICFTTLGMYAVFTAICDFLGGCELYKHHKDFFDAN